MCLDVAERLSPSGDEWDSERVSPSVDEKVLRRAVDEKLLRRAEPLVAVLVN